MNYQQPQQTAPIAYQQPQGNALAPQAADLFSPTMLQTVDMLSKSNILPANYQGEQNKGNVFIALEYAHRYNVPAMTVMQNLHVIKGKPSWSSPFLIGLFNTTKRSIFTPIRFKNALSSTGETGVQAYTTDLHSGEVFNGTLITMTMAKAEGWYDKPGSKWKTMPEQMAKYRAAVFLIRELCPELTMGVYTDEEVEDTNGLQQPHRPDTSQEVNPLEAFQQ